MRFSLLFLLLTLPLFAKKTSDKPPPAQSFNKTQERLFPKVNLITGDYFEQECDLIIAGAQPLTYRRFTNQNGFPDPRYGGWRINPECDMRANFEWSKMDRFVLLGERDGGLSFYANKAGNHFALDAKKHPPHTEGCSGQTHPLNTHIVYNKLRDPKNKHRFAWKGSVTDGTGRIRTFSTPMHAWLEMIHTKKRSYAPDKWTPYQCQVQEERLPNGNCICYRYARISDDKYFPQYYFLKQITAYNRDKTKILNTLTFAYQTGREGVRSVEAIGSDGRSVFGQHTEHRGSKITTYNPKGFALTGTPKRTLLTSVSAPGKPKVHYQYDGIVAYGFKAISIVHHPEGRSFHTYSYQDTGKVIHQSAPVGKKGELIPIFRFQYHRGATDLFDAHGNKTTTRYDSDKRVTAIEKYDGPTLYSVEKKIFDPDTGNLLGTVTFDKDQHALLATTFAYDKNHNAIKQTLHGNLTGKNPSPIALNDQGLPHDPVAQTYTLTRTFSDDGFNLKLSETDGLGKTTRFTYVPHTNLLAAELVYDHKRLCKRTFITYDDCAVPIKKVVDDGTSENPNDLSGITFRRITLTTPKATMPCLGLPEIVEEKTLDENGHEVLLHKVLYTYHPSGQILSETHYDAHGEERYTLRNTYNEQELCVQSTDALGYVTSYEYDANHNLIQVQGPRADQEKQITYDKANRPIQIKERQSDGSFLTTQKKFNALGQVTQKKDPCGHTTHFAYDPLGRVTHITHPDGATESKEYDLFDNVISHTNPNGYTTRTTYTVRGDPVHIQYPDGTEEHFTYHLNGTLHSATDKAGTRTVYSYDIFGHETKKQTFSPDNQKLKTTSATYTPFCQLSATDGEGDTTTYFHDRAGRQIAQKTAERVITYSYDSLGHRHTTTQQEARFIQEYNVRGECIEERVEDLQGHVLELSRTLYDEAKNPIQIITAHGTTTTHFNSFGQPLKIIDPLGHTTTYHYDFERQYIQTTTDPKGVQTVKLHDARGRVVEMTLQDPEGNTLAKTNTAYDPNGNPTAITHHLIQGTSFLKTLTHTFEYGPGNRLEKQIESGQKKSLTLYDSSGRVQTLIKPDGTKLHHTYDPLGRLKTFKSHDFEYHYTYDKNNHLLAVYDAVSNTQTTRMYDALGNLTQETLAHGLTLKNIFDDHGRRTQCTLPDGSDIQYAYRAHQLFHVTRGPYTTTYQQHDLSGRLIEASLPANLGTLRITRDALGRIEHFASPFYTAHFPKDAFDPNGNLTHYTFVDPLGPIDALYTYDPLNQLTSENEHSYLYDSLNNRLKKDDLKHTVNTLCQITHDGETQYTYDANGNLISDGTTTYFYDSQDRLIKVTKEGVTTTYTYDPFHRRLTKNETRFVWDGQNEIGAVEKETLKELRVLGSGLGAEIGAMVLLELHQKAFVPLHDHRGSLVVLVDPTAQHTETYRYTAFGEPLTPATLSPWRFSSKRTDPETSFIYFGRRYYNPHLGRWITCDPSGFSDGPNLYAYVHNAPLTSFDLYGLFKRENHGLLYARLCGGIIGDFFNFMGMFKPKNYTTFENHFKEKSCNLDLGLPDLPVGEIGRTNGVLNSKADATASAMGLSVMAGGCNIKFTYNASHGHYDAHEAAMNIFFKINTNPVFLTRQRWNTHFDKSPDVPYYEECHSQGVAIVRNALMDYPAERRDKLIIRAFAPADYISQNLCKNIKHYVSFADPVTLFDLMGRIKNADTIIKVKPHQNASKLFDHTISSPTYKEHRRAEIRKYLNLLEDYK